MKGKGGNINHMTSPPPLPHKKITTCICKTYTLDEIRMSIKAHKPITLKKGPFEKLRTYSVLLFYGVSGGFTHYSHLKVNGFLVRCSNGIINTQ